jgi:crotonobetainyl-CoA:carnitine CoA-transferase CaiB-like acyl-CoA transferase
LFLQIHKLKIPAGVIQNVKEVFEMKEAKELIVTSGSLTGVRTFVACSGDEQMNLLPPPHFGEHTEEVLNSI